MRVVAASTDGGEASSETADRLQLTYPVGYGLALEDTARRLGAYYEQRRGILHATGFLVRPGGTIATLTYSAGPIGRLVPDDVRRLVEFWKRKES